MKGIKRIFGLFVFAAVMLLCTLSVSAKVDINNTDLKGDSGFISKIKNLDNEKPEQCLYVAANGSDSNEGTQDSPFKTINAALDSASAGTTVYVREGIYTENVYFPQSGKEGKYIALKNYPDEKPVIKGTGKNDGAIIELDGHDYIQIEGFELCDYSARWCYGIIFAGGENHIIIRNNTIHNIKCSKPNDPDNSGANAILLFGETEEPISNVYIGDNYVYDLVTGWCEAISVTANCEYVNVINNKVDNSTNIGIDFYGNNADGYCPVEELNQPRYCIAAGNEVSNCVCDYATCYGLYVDGARDIVIENNISHNNQGGIEIGSEERNESYPVKNIVVRNNLIYNNNENGITVGGWNDGSSTGDPLSGVVYNTSIYNNTVVNNAQTYAGQLHIAMVNGLDVRNNIFYTDEKTPFVGSDVDKGQIQNLTFKNNLYYSPNFDENSAEFELMESSQEGMTEWKALTGETGSFSDPLFASTASNDYRTYENSPAVNKGDGSVYSGMYDIANNNRVVDIIDIGAYEYQNGTVIIPTTESTTEGTTSVIETGTEETTLNYGTDKIWNFGDSVFSSYTERVNAQIEGLYIYNPASAVEERDGGVIDGISFTKDIKLNKKSSLDKNDLKNAFGMELKAGSAVTVYYMDNGSGGSFSLSDSNMNVIATVQTGTGGALDKCVLTVENDGFYYLHASGNANTYVYGIGVTYPKTTADGAYLLRIVAGIENADEDTRLKYDYNNNGRVDIADVVILLERI
ncbi:MAG: right-handed parallel beta-helix repeat-containing protein [Clostridia bacterium]|nr:right-handed parallel beta-helix repeat-containing protein [Clostridia bacterium]